MSIFEGTAAKEGRKLPIGGEEEVGQVLRGKRRAALAAIRPRERRSRRLL